MLPDRVGEDTPIFVDHRRSVVDGGVWLVGTWAGRKGLFEGTA